jgi:hypothetical protein
MRCEPTQTPDDIGMRATAMDTTASAPGASQGDLARLTLTLKGTQHGRDE